MVRYKSRRKSKKKYSRRRNRRRYSRRRFRFGEVDNKTKTKTSQLGCFYKYLDNKHNVKRLEIKLREAIKEKKEKEKEISLATKQLETLVNNNRFKLKGKDYRKKFQELERKIIGLYNERGALIKKQAELEDTKNTVELMRIQEFSNYCITELTASISVDDSLETCSLIPEYEVINENGEEICHPVKGKKFPRGYFKDIRYIK